MHSFIQDIRYGFRALRKSPGFTVIAVVTLALGMAANTAMFSIVNGILLRPLPVPNASQIVVLTADQKNNPLGNGFSYPDLVDFTQLAQPFADVFGYRLTLKGLAADNRADTVIASEVSSNFFSVLGVKPAVGRLIMPSEGRVLGADPVVVLGYSYWQKRFGGDASVVGKRVRINGRDATIVGVVEKSFTGVYSIVDCQAYYPLSFAAQEPEKNKAWTDRAARSIVGFARLHSGVSKTQARSSLNLIAKRLAQSYPAADQGIAINVIPERLARPEPDPQNPIPSVAAIFLALAGLVLLLACFNIANVLLVRATVRRREMAIRAALGGTRSRLVRQWLSESMLLAVFGGAAGIILAWWAGDLVSSLPLQTDLPIKLNFRPDGTVILYALAAVVLTALVVGLLPATRVARVSANEVLREGGRGASGSRRHILRNSLVVAQVAGSLLLLIVAGLFGRSLMNAQKLNLGFDARNLLNLGTNADEAGYSEARGRELFKLADERLRALPGVTAVVQALTVPMGYVGESKDVFIEGKPLQAGEHAPTIGYNAVSANYFDILRMPLARGRSFTESDDEKAPLVGVVNETMAKKLWPNQDPIGKRFSIKSQTGPFIEVVGVAKDGKYRNPVEDPMPFFFVPVEQQYSPFRAFQLKTSVPPEQLALPAEHVMAELAPGLPVMDVQSMEQSLQGGNGFFIFKFGVQLTTVLGALGMVLAVVGVYGVVSYAAAQRVREIGIRMALGAERGHIARLVLGQGLLLVGVGIALGLVAAAAGTRVIGDFVVGISPTDPATFAAVVGVLSVVALLACWIPARRAMRVDPMIALRYE